MCLCWMASLAVLTAAFFILFSSRLCEAASSGGSDMVLKNGVIYTAGSNDTAVEAVAVDKGKIVYAGGAEGVTEFIGAVTAVVDLGGKIALPGFWDTHVHAPGAKLVELYQINLYNCKSLEKAGKIIADYISANPRKEIYYGGGLTLEMFSGEELLRGPRKERLDEICPDRPVIITFIDLHGCWMNSRAFEAFGIESDTRPPAGGVIEIDPQTGSPWGTLKESAMELVEFEEFSAEQRIKAFKSFQKMMNSYGYVGVMAIDAPFESLGALRERGELTLRVAGSAVLDPRKDIAEQFGLLKKNREKYNCDLIKAGVAKIFVDGVVEHGTAFLREPYRLGGLGFDGRGVFLWDKSELAKAFAMANNEGFQLHVHSIGDAATGNVLDALEEARKVTGDGDFRNTITHLQLVSEGDYARFRRLGVIANVQPYWAFKMPFTWENIDLPKLGERAERQHPIGSFFKAGVTVAASSDYPVTIEPDPMCAVETAVTRDIDNQAYCDIFGTGNCGGDKYVLDKNESVSVAQILKAFTIDGAYSTFNERITGSIEVGKDADIVILDNDLFKIEPKLIDTVKVCKTILKGEIVYDIEI